MQSQNYNYCANYQIYFLCLVIGCMAVVPMGTMQNSTKKQRSKATLFRNSPALTYKVSTGELMNPIETDGHLSRYYTNALYQGVMSRLIGTNSKGRIGQLLIKLLNF